MRESANGVGKRRQSFPILARLSWSFRPLVAGPVLALKGHRLMKNLPCAVAWFGTACLMMSIGCGRSATVGQLCDLTVDAGPSQGVVNLNAGACKTGLCLKPVLAPASNFVDPPTGATCTDECSSDSDCDGELRNLERRRGHALQGRLRLRGAVCRRPALLQALLPVQGFPRPERRPVAGRMSGAGCARQAARARPAAPRPPA